MKEENEESKGVGFMSIVSFAIAAYMMYLGLSSLV